MKNITLLLIFTLSINLLSAQNKEEEAIKKVCIAESQAFAYLDYDAYASYHAQTADEQLVLNNPNGTYSAKVGWDSISTTVKKWIKAGKKDNVKKVFGDNFTIVIYGDMAFAAYDGWNNISFVAGEIKEQTIVENNVKGEWTRKGRGNADNGLRSISCVWYLSQKREINEVGVKPGRNSLVP